MLLLEQSFQFRVQGKAHTPGGRQALDGRPPAPLAFRVLSSLHLLSGEVRCRAPLFLTMSHGLKLPRLLGGLLKALQGMSLVGLVCSGPGSGTCQTLPFPRCRFWPARLLQAAQHTAELKVCS